MSWIVTQRRQKFQTRIIPEVKAYGVDDEVVEEVDQSSTVKPQSVMNKGAWEGSVATALKLYPIRASQRPTITEDDKGQYKSRSPSNEELVKKSNATDPEMRRPVTD